MPAIRSAASRRAAAWLARPTKVLRTAALTASLASSPLRAEPGFELSIASDDRFRGISVSGERPVATGLISYDDSSGFYAGISGTVVATRDEGLRPLRSTQYVGYAHRVDGSVAIDVGVTNRLYSRYFTGEYADRFTELYVGLVGRRISSHLYLSPDYDGNGGRSAYLEVNAQVLERGDWSLGTHVGILAPPREPGRSWRPEVDWRVGAIRRFGRLAVGLQWVGSGPNHDTGRWQQGVVLSARRSF